MPQLFLPRGGSATTWDTFFAAEVGASAALAGLIFVGLSINLQRILSLPTVANRAAQSIMLLVGVLGVASVLLIPAQTGAAQAVEVLAVALPLWAGLDLIELRNWARIPTTFHRALGYHTIELQVPCALFVGGAVFVGLGNAGGLFWFPAAMIVCFLVAVLEAWVLLVEINR